MKMISLYCQNEKCGRQFSKPLKEHKRSMKLGRLEFCSLSCSRILANRSKKRDRTITNKNLISGSERDDFTPFRWFMARIRNRRKRHGSTDFTLECLRKLWEDQKGICPFTGWKMVLPQSIAGDWPKDSDRERASLDRIDNSNGYLQGNVRFVSKIANYARNEYSDDDLLEFCNAVVNHMK